MEQIHKLSMTLLEFRNLQIWVAKGNQFFSRCSFSFFHNLSKANTVYTGTARWVCQCVYMQCAYKVFTAHIHEKYTSRSRISTPYSEREHKVTSFSNDLHYYLYRFSSCALACSTFVHFRTHTPHLHHGST